jgi:hypothetical protein
MRRPVTFATQSDRIELLGVLGNASLLALGIVAGDELVTILGAATLVSLGLLSLRSL